MLGKAADRFMLGQMRERVLAIPSNAGSSSMQVPDRERPGTPHVTMLAGPVPGPQRQVSSAYVPGMGSMPAPARPPSAFLPGLSSLPGMGALDTSTLMTVGVIGVGIWLMMRKKG